MEATVVGIVHDDDAVRSQLCERVEGEAGLVLAAASPRVDDVRLPSAPAVLVAGGSALDDPRLRAARAALVVITNGAPAEARAALALAAADLIAWPTEAARLPSAIRSAALLRQAGAARTPGRIVAIAGARGGLGTTTIAAWVARALPATALVELDAAGALATWAEAPAMPLRTWLDAPRRLEVADIALGVPVVYGEPGDRAPSPEALRFAMSAVRAGSECVVVDAGRGDGTRGIVAREADVTVLVLGDDVWSVRAATARGLLGVPWVHRRLGRGSAMGARLLTDAVGSAPCGSVPHDRTVARAADLGRLPALPTGLRPLVTMLGGAPEPARLSRLDRIKGWLGR